MDSLFINLKFKISILILLSIFACTNKHNCMDSSELISKLESYSKKGSNLFFVSSADLCSKCQVDKINNAVTTFSTKKKIPLLIYQDSNSIDFESKDLSNSVDLYIFNDSKIFDNLSEMSKSKFGPYLVETCGSCCVKVKKLD